MTMNPEHEKKTPTVPTEKRYNSVEELLAGESVAAEVNKKFHELNEETVIIQNLVQMRKSAGLTQEQLAEILGKNQSAVSKLESGTDDDLTLKELYDYVRATDQPFTLVFSQPMNDFDWVKWHAFGIKEHLLSLAKTAHEDTEMEQKIQAFFGEAFFNILDILGKCHSKMPKDELQIRFRRTGVSLRTPTRHTEPTLA